MKNIKLYELEETYRNEESSLKYPTVSYTKDTDKVWYMERPIPNYFIATYNVTSTTSTTRILGNGFTTSQVKEMYIDEVKQDAIISDYTFSTTGEHIVKCVMSDEMNICNSMFSNCKSLTSLDVSNFNTSNVTDMSWMFQRCGSLTSLDVSNFDTSKVTNIHSMFEYCSGLTSLDVSNFNTSAVTDMGMMFYGCKSLTSLYLSNFNTSNVTNMCDMFDGCSGLTSLDVSNFDTSNVTDMSYMFDGCTSLTSLDVSNFNTSAVTNMSEMFFGCSGLTSLDLSSFNTSNLTTMRYMFSECSGLTSLDLSNFNTSKVTSMYGMFRYCTSLTSVTFGSQADVSNIGNSYYYYEHMFTYITTTGTLYYPSAYATAWNNLLVTNQSSTQFPSTWTAVPIDYENGETVPTV